MEISDKEKTMIEAGKHRAIIRKEGVKERIGDVIFDINGIIYIIKGKHHWTLRRINSQRGTIDFGCKTAAQFRLMYNMVYGQYFGKSKELYWLITVKKDKVQKTLGVFSR